MNKCGYDECLYLLLRTLNSLLTVSHLFCVVLVKLYICNTHYNNVRTSVL
jgi:hypothetical protein